jgi:two-component system sensor histidine kinase YesM
MKKQSIFKSTIVRIISAIILLVLPVNILTLFLSAKAIESSKNQSISGAQYILDMAETNIEDTLYRLDRKLISLRLSDTDFIVLATAADKLELPQNTTARGVRIATATKTLQLINADYPLVDLVYVYFPEMETMLVQGHPGVSVTNSRQFLEDMVTGPDTTVTKGTVFTLDQTGMLFTMNSWGNTDFGCLVNLENLLDKINVTQDKGHQFFFVNKNYDIMTSAGQKLLSKKNYTFADLQNDRNYEVLTTKIGDSDLVLVEVLDWNNLQNLPVAMQIVQILSLVLAFTVVPILIWYMYKQVIRPIHKLTHAIDVVNSGNLDYQISIEKESREFEQINQNFNEMLTQVKNLKIDVYEQELEKKNIKMRYLSQQIQPHFILNALNIIYSYEPDEYPLIQKMVLCISKYFRYIIKTNAEFVMLSQEMDHIKNYFEIQNARYPGLFFSIVEYEEDLATAQIPPLIVQSFAENAIKHSLKIGNKISIFVITDKMTDDNGQTMMRIRLADTGEGISDEILKKIERFKQTEKHQEGLGIGIENSIERLKYLYDNKGYIKIWRDENYPGTTVEIVLPIFTEPKE